MEFPHFNLKEMKNLMYIIMSLFCFHNLFSQNNSLTDIYYQISDKPIYINVTKYDKQISNSHVRLYNILENDNTIVYYPMTEVSLTEDIIGNKWSDVPVFYIYYKDEKKYILTLFDEGQLTYRKTKSEYTLYFDLNVQYLFVNYYLFNSCFNLTHIVKIPIYSKSIKSNNDIIVYDISNKIKCSFKQQDEFNNSNIKTLFGNLNNCEKIKDIDRKEIEKNVDMLPNWIPINY